MRRLPALLASACAIAVVLVLPAGAADRMWMGFHDDPSFRWVPDRADRIRGAANQSTTMIRLLVQWNIVAPGRPAVATDPFDLAYRLDDLDEALRTAQANDIEVLLTISGAPSWTNGNRTPNNAPTNMRDLTDFAQAIASRYSGRYDGYPFVRFWSVWNEPNLHLFLAPQFNAAGASVAPATYARLFAAAYTGLKAGNPAALVAMGETSARGRDKRKPGASDTHSPGKFAELVAKANPKLKFDAWAHHPYPSNPTDPPAQIVRWPNVSLKSLPRFETSLNTWFNRKVTPIWITEYGHQTNPPDVLGIPWSTQGTYLQQAIALSKTYSFVPMFIWFVYQDDPGNPWDSGIYTRGGTPKPAAPKFTVSAKPLDARNAIVKVKGGAKNPNVTVFTRRFCANDAPGARIGMTWRVFDGPKLIAVGQTAKPLTVQCTITPKILFAPVKGKSYTVTFALNDINGITLARRLTLVGS